MSSIESYECVRCGTRRTFVSVNPHRNVPKVMPCPRCKSSGETSHHVGSITQHTTSITSIANRGDQ